MHPYGLIPPLLEQGAGLKQLTERSIGAGDVVDACKAALLGLSRIRSRHCEVCEGEEMVLLVVGEERQCGVLILSLESKWVSNQARIQAS